MKRHSRSATNALRATYPNAKGSLAPFGFSLLEEETYAALLESPHSTGYGIAQRIKKPVANTYKALELLLAKGAVMVEDGDPALYTAVPIREVVEQIQRGFREQGQRAIARFADAKLQPDSRVYRLGTRGQTLNRARTLITNAKDVILVDVFPAILSELRTELEAASERGVLIAGKVYGPTNFSSPWIAVEPEAASVIERWPADWLILVADGEETLIAVLDRLSDKVFQSIWSRSPMLSFAMFSSQYAEILLARVQQELEQGKPAADLKNIIMDYRKLRDKISGTKGYHRLTSQMGNRGES